MEEKEVRLAHIKTVKTERRGGSLYVILPSPVAKFLDVEEGEKISYIKDETRNCMIIINAKRAKVVLPGFKEHAELEFSVSETAFRKLFRKKEDS